jgi:AcrR family transcriptional regulator
MSTIEPTRVLRGRPRSVSAHSHAVILNAVFELLQETSVRDLTMEAIAKRAKVGKPTLYKWWPSKAALVFAVFHERVAVVSDIPKSTTAEQAIRTKVRRLIHEFNGLFGKVMADLIAEGQSEPEILSELVEQHINARRTATAADIEEGKRNGEFDASVDAQLLIDAIFGPLYFRHLLRHAPLTQAYGDELLTQVLKGARPAGSSSRASSRTKKAKEVSTQS